MKIELKKMLRKFIWLLVYLYIKIFYKLKLEIWTHTFEDYEDDYQEERFYLVRRKYIRVLLWPFILPFTFLFTGLIGCIDEIVNLNNTRFTRWVAKSNLSKQQMVYMYTNSII